MPIIYAAIHELGYWSVLIVEVEYGIIPCDDFVGLGDDAELLSVFVTHWNGRKRHNHWIWNDLDKIAEKLINEKWDSEICECCLEDWAERKLDGTSC